jgi:hypothetical protein
LEKTYTLLDDILALPYPGDQLSSIDERTRKSLHSDNGGTGGDVLDETAVEGSSGEIRVVLLGKSWRGG